MTEIVISIIEIALAIYAYVSIGRILFWSWTRKGLDDEGAFFGAALWPITVPFYLLYKFVCLVGVIERGIAKFRISNIKLPKRKSRIGQMAPGIPRPSYVLAGMIAAKMLQSPDDFDGVSYWTFGYKDAVLSYNDSGLLLSKDKKTILAFTHEEDREVLFKAAGTVVLHKKELQQARIEHDRQLKSCGLIEDFFGTVIERPDELASLAKSVK